MISAVDLTKIYRMPAGEVRVFERLNLEVRKGSLVAIVGPSGAGKSTLLHLIGGLDVPTSGKVLFNGDDIFQWGAGRLAEFRNRHVGFVFQFHHLLPEFSTLENTMIPRLIRGASRDEAEPMARRLLERVGLTDRLEHRVGELSGGEQQRVAIARALVGEPAVLLADEPTGNLDHRTGDLVFQLIRDLHAECGLTSILVTHNDRIASGCDRILELDDGALRRSSE